MEVKHMESGIGTTYFVEWADLRDLKRLALELKENGFECNGVDYDLFGDTLNYAKKSETKWDEVIVRLKSNWDKCWGISTLISRGIIW